MPPLTRPNVLQLDFDGTVVGGDASVGMLTRYVGKWWAQDFDEALATMRTDPQSSALVDSMKRGIAALDPSNVRGCIDYAKTHHRQRGGLAELVQTARHLAIEIDVCSYGYDFYISSYLKDAGVLDQVNLRCGRTWQSKNQMSLSYTGPNGEDVSNNWKEAWSADYKRRGLSVVYVGDGRSDLVAALQADVIFARDELLANVPAGYKGTLRPFDTLSDVANGLRELFAAGS